jgi:hypothetical protein
MFRIIVLYGSFERYKEMNNWLNEHAGKIYYYRTGMPKTINFRKSKKDWTMFWKFGGDEEMLLELWFRDKNVAVLFKLMWGGEV